METERDFCSQHGELKAIADFSFKHMEKIEEKLDHLIEVVSNQGIINNELKNTKSDLNRLGERLNSHTKIIYGQLENKVTKKDMMIYISIAGIFVTGINIIIPKLI